jgi:hypothetical protein
MLFHRMPQNAGQHISLTHEFGRVSLAHAVVIVHEEMRSLQSSSTRLLVRVSVMEFVCVRTSRRPSSYSRRGARRGWGS